MWSHTTEAQKLVCLVYYGMEKFLHFPVAQEGIWLPKLGAQVKICLTLTFPMQRIERLFYLSTETNDDCSKNPGQLLLYAKSLGNLNQPFGERLLQKIYISTAQMHKIEIPVKSSSFLRKLSFSIFLICSVILFTQIYFSMLCYGMGWEFSSGALLVSSALK